MDKTNNKWIEITERDMRIFKLLAVFRVMYGELLAWAAGYTANYGQKRIRKLAQCGYLEVFHPLVNRPAMYTLTEKAIRELDDKPPRYFVENENAIHECIVAEIAVWTSCTTGLPIEEVLTERQQKKHNTKFKTYPDLYIPPVDIAIEYERTPKTTAKTRQKIIGNSVAQKQIWVIDEKHASLGKRLQKIAAEESTKYAPIEMVVTTKEKIEKDLKKYMEEDIYHE